MEAAAVPAAGSSRASAAIGWLRANILWLLLVAALAVLAAINLGRTAEATQTGISTGAIYALIALGYTLVYGIIELINFAHGDVFMLGSFVATSLFVSIAPSGKLGLGSIILTVLAGLLVASFATATLNVLIERVAYRPLRNAPKLAPLITAIGMSFILQNVGLLWHTGAVGVPDLINSQHVVFTIGTVSVANSDIFAVAVTIPVLLALSFFVSQTRYGKAMRATAQDADAARLMGINVDRTIALTFLTGGLMAGTAGVIYALYNTTVRFDSGFTNGLIAFTAAVMGGIGNLKGAVVGGLVIGIIQANSDAVIGEQWQSTVVFGILVLVMVFKPEGLLGEPGREG
jgi:branched-chain amino acid transport system permease protein